MCTNVFFISSESPHDPSDLPCDLLEGIWPLVWRPLYKVFELSTHQLNKPIFLAVLVNRMTKQTNMCQISIVCQVEKKGYKT